MVGTVEKLGTHLLNHSRELLERARPVHSVVWVCSGEYRMTEIGSATYRTCLRGGAGAPSGVGVFRRIQNDRNWRSHLQGVFEGRGFKDVKQFNNSRELFDGAGPTTKIKSYRLALSVF